LNFQKSILPLIYKIYAFGLVFFFLVPSGLKLIHAYEFHTIQNECKHSTTHIHASSLHNDVLDYYFHVLAESQSKSFDIDTPLIFRKKSADYCFSLYKSELLFSSTRGPPNC